MLEGWDAGMGLSGNGSVFSDSFCQHFSISKFAFAMLRPCQLELRLIFQVR
jgi:hypothetical protein